MDKESAANILREIMVDNHNFTWEQDKAFLLAIDTLLKENEVVPKRKVTHYYICPSCNNVLDSGCTFYCGSCGKLLLWDEAFNKRK